MHDRVNIFCREALVASWLGVFCRSLLKNVMSTGQCQHLHSVFQPVLLAPFVSRIVLPMRVSFQCVVQVPEFVNSLPASASDSFDALAPLLAYLSFEQNCCITSLSPAHPSGPGKLQGGPGWEWRQLMYSSWTASVRRLDGFLTVACA